MNPEEQKDIVVIAPEIPPKSEEEIALRKLNNFRKNKKDLLIPNYPDAIRNEVDDLIKRDMTEEQIQAILKDKYSGQIIIPNLPKIRAYRRTYHRAVLNVSGVDDAKINEIERALSTIDSVAVQRVDKACLLINLMAKALSRVRQLELDQTEEIDPQIEMIILRYYTEIREMLTALTKFSDEIIKMEKDAMKKMVEASVAETLVAVRDAMLEVDPSKLDAFQGALKRKLHGDKPVTKPDNGITQQ